MATTTPPKPAPLGRSRNPYELLKDADRGSRALVMANHRERIRALAWAMTPAAHTPPEHAQANFLAIKHGCCTVLSLVSLIAAEVTANDYPHDLPFHPDALELADAIRRNHLAALQIVKDRIRTGALPVRAATGIPVACNDDPAVLAWCNDLEAVTPPRALCTTLADARAFVQAAGLNPLRELAGEAAPPSEQVPSVPAEEPPADLEAPPAPFEPTGTPNELEDYHQPTSAPPCPPCSRNPDRRKQGESLFIDLRRQGKSEREAEDEVHERFGTKGLSRSSLQRAWKKASRQRAPTALEQLSEAAVKK